MQRLDRRFGRNSSLQAVWVIHDAGYIASVRRVRLNERLCPVDPGISRGVTDLCPSRVGYAQPVTRAIEVSHPACKDDFDENLFLFGESHHHSSSVCFHLNTYFEVYGMYAMCTNTEMNRSLYTTHGILAPNERTHTGQYRLSSKKPRWYWHRLDFLFLIWKVASRARFGISAFLVMSQENSVWLSCWALSYLLCEGRQHMCEASLSSDHGGGSYVHTCSMRHQVNNFWVTGEPRILSRFSTAVPTWRQNTWS